MHTSRVLSSSDFEITADGHPATVADVLPGFDEHTRLGIVIGQNLGGAGASMLILAAVTAFYDRLRATETDFFAYPDYFAFHVAGSGSHPPSLRKLDVFPEHKEPVVADDAEAILQAINDRAITHLLVADRGPAHVRLNRETRHSAERRITAALAYSPSGRVTDADVAITSCVQAEEFVTAMTGHGPRTELVQDGRPRETFRRLALDEALAMLPATAQ